MLDSTDTTHGLQSIAAGSMTFSDAGKILSWSIWAGAPGPLSLQVLAAAKLPIAAALGFSRFSWFRCFVGQVWRSDAQNPDNFQLVCDNAVSALQTGLNDFDIPEAEQCTFLPGDSVGWSQRPSDSGVISYTTQGATDDDVVRYR